MVEIGRVRVKTGNAPIEQKISAYPPQADICAFGPAVLLPLYSHASMGWSTPRRRQLCCIATSKAPFANALA
jgi:hypothetical protein